MKVTVYRHGSQDTERVVGCYPTYDLYEPTCALDPLESCDAVEVGLPDSYRVKACDYENRFIDPQGRECVLNTNNDNGFWVTPLKGDGLGQYVKVVENPVYEYGNGEPPYLGIV